MSDIIATTKIEDGDTFGSIREKINNTFLNVNELNDNKLEDANNVILDNHIAAGSVSLAKLQKGVVETDNVDQDVDGVKTFLKTPKTSAAVTDANHLTTKQYVDSAADTKFVRLSGGSHALTSGANLTYTIAQFTGSGLEPAKIRGLIVRCYLWGKRSGGYITATMPDGIAVEIARFQNGDDNAMHVVSTFTVPINADQATVSFVASGAYASYELVGVIQRT